MDGRKALCVIPYFSYVNRREAEKAPGTPLQQRLQAKHGRPVPGNRLHCANLRRRIPGHFDRWYSRPRSSHKLYWRLREMLRLTY